MLTKYIDLLYLRKKDTTNCLRCKSEKNVKNRVLKGVQRFKCKDCGINYKMEYKSTAKQIDTKKFGLMLYSEGLGFQSISRLFNG